VIFLTRTEELHMVNLSWHPEGERLLWRTDIQEQKISQASGDRVLRYEKRLKRGLCGSSRGCSTSGYPTAESAIPSEAALE